MQHEPAVHSFWNSTQSLTNRKEEKPEMLPSIQKCANSAGCEREKQTGGQLSGALARHSLCDIILQTENRRVSRVFAIIY